MASASSGTVAKALLVMDQFNEGEGAFTLSQIAARTGLHKSTALRLCATLEEGGFLQRDGNMTYRLGPKIGRLARAYRQQFRLEDIVRPRLQRLRAETGESASYYELEGEERLCRFRENSRHNIRHHLDEGIRLPADRGVVGRVLLAFSGRQRQDLRDIRDDGHLIAQGRESHTTSVAVPVLCPDGSLAGGLVVSGPSVRFTLNACRAALPRLKAAAAEIEAHLEAPASSRPGG